MMLSPKTLPLAAVLLIALLSVSRTGLVAADDATATPSPATPEPSITVVTAVVPTSAPPVVREEHTPVPSLTAIIPTAVPTANPIPVSATAAPSAPPDYTSAIYDPSPAQLRESARLRWGKHIPAKVRRWAFLIVPDARRYGVDPNLVAAVMTMESGGDPRAWSGADARGLMQVLHGPFDPAANIDEGVRMLARFLHEFHDVSIALAAYNAGPAAVLSYGGIPPYRETRDYVIIVTYLYDLYGHRSLTDTRRAQYRATLADLRRFADQRRKVKLLSKMAALKAQKVLDCTARNTCQSIFDQQVFPTMDPFWPMPGPPDPLQHVGPAVASS